MAEDTGCDPIRMLSGLVKLGDTWLLRDPFLDFLHLEMKEEMLFGVIGVFHDRIFLKIVLSRQTERNKIRLRWIAPPDCDFPTYDFSHFRSKYYHADQHIAVAASILAICWCACDSREQL